MMKFLTKVDVTQNEAGSFVYSVSLLDISTGKLLTGKPLFISQNFETETQCRQNLGISLLSLVNQVSDLTRENYLRLSELRKEK